MASNTRRKPS